MISSAPGSAPSGTSSSPEGRIATTGRRLTRTGGLPDRPEHGEIGGAEQAAGREHEVTGGDVLAHLAHVGVNGATCALDRRAVVHARRPRA